MALLCLLGCPSDEQFRIQVSVGHGVDNFVLPHDRLQNLQVDALDERALAQPEQASQSSYLTRVSLILKQDCQLLLGLPLLLLELDSTRRLQGIVANDVGLKVFRAETEYSRCAGLLHLLRSNFLGGQAFIGLRWRLTSEIALSRFDRRWHVVDLAVGVGSDKIMTWPRLFLLIATLSKSPRSLIVDNISVVVF